MKKALSLLLCALMVVTVVSGLAACTTPEGPQNTSDLRPEGYSPAITLTLNNMSYVQYDAVFNAMDWNLANNAVTELIEKEFGVKFELMIDVSDIGVYFQKMAAEIAAGKIADLNCMGELYYGIPNLKAAEQNDLIADLTSFVKGTDERAKPSEETLLLWEQAGESIFYPGTFEGKIKTLPWVKDSRSSAYNFMYIRADWLEAVGKQVPTTIDELTEVMRAFKNNIDGAYGLVISNTLLAQGENYCPIFDMFGVQPLMWYETESGDLAYGATKSENMKAALALLRDWYAEGLINSGVDNDFSMLTGLHYTSQEIVNGKAGIHFGSTSMGFIGNTVRKNKDARFVAVPLFAADGYELSVSTGNDGYYFYSVGANCQYPEVAMKLYNFCVEMEIDAEGKYYDYLKKTEYENERGETVTDYPAIQFAPIRSYAPVDIEAEVEFLEKILNQDEDGLTNTQKDIYDEYWTAVNSGETTYKNYWIVEQYKEDGVMSTYYELLDEVTFARNKFYAVNTPAMDKHGSGPDGLLLTGAHDIIKGTKPLDYWDTILDMWSREAGNEITAEVNAWWDNISSK